jgi:Uma2 family endonuclease
MSTTLQPESSSDARVDAPPIPKLESGDRLSLKEFRHRYEAMPHLKKAELIEGVVYVQAPVSTEHHGHPHFSFVTWLGVYQAGTPGTQGADNATVRLDLDNEPQPDIFLRILPEYGGQSSREGAYATGAPEWVGEIAASSASYDLHDKLNAYRRNGVREYVVWRVFDREFDWFVLRDSQFVRLHPKDGVFRSEVFPGLWLDSTAMLDGRLADVLTLLQSGMNSEEHKTFVAELAKKKTQ